MLSLQHHGALRMLFKRDRDADAKRFIEDALKDTALANEYQQVQEQKHNALKQQLITKTEYEALLVKWFLDKGYATTPGAVTTAFKGVIINEQLDYSGRYKCKIADSKNTKHPVIEIDIEKHLVKVDEQPILHPSFGTDHVLWMSSGGNNSSAILTFSKHSKGIDLTGKYAATSTEELPQTFNLIGSN